MHRTWKFLQVKKNREILAWLGGGAVILAGGLWTALTFFWPQETSLPPGGSSNNAEARNGSTAIGGNANGSTITNIVTDGRAPSTAPPNQPK
jgi:hypothetical protein